MKPLFFFLLYFTTLALPVKSQDQQVVPYTLADRDRTIRTEIKLEALEIRLDALETKMDARFEAVNSRIDAIFWILGVLVALMLFMLGYMIWDRRTALKPAIDKAEAAEILSSTNTRVLRD